MTHYLDHAATTPMRPCAVQAWVEASGQLNSGTPYASGRKARSVLDDARESIAELLGCEPIEVIFTASGTEADNIAVQGLYKTRVAAGAPGRIVTTPIEHSAVLEAATLTGAEVDYLPVGKDGHVASLKPLDEEAAVAACMVANNETGALLDVGSVVAAVDRYGTPVHADAVQAVGRVSIDFAGMGVTTLAASAHKFGGPRGVGLLLAKRSPAPNPIMVGGGQERGVRAGTVDVAGASATAAALREAVGEMEAEAARLGALRDKLHDAIASTIDGAVINTVQPALPTHLNVSFERTDGDSLIMLLDQMGVEAATGSACHAGVNRLSHVLEAMGVEPSLGIGTLRISLGHTTTAEDVDALIGALPEVISRARAVHSL